MVLMDFRRFFIDSSWFSSHFEGRWPALRLRLRLPGHAERLHLASGALLRAAGAPLRAGLEAAAAAALRCGQRVRDEQGVEAELC